MRSFGIFLLVLLLIQPLRARAESDCLRIASIAEAPGVDFGVGLAEALYREAGLCATVLRLPTERIKRMLDTGEIDGVVVRTREFLSSYPIMLAVPTPLLIVDERLYWLAGHVRPSGPDARIGLPRGWILRRIEAESTGGKAVEVDNDGALTKMAESGRIDGFIMGAYEFDTFAPSEPERSAFASESIKIVPLYHAISTKHADLVPALDAAIQRMVARGDVARLLKLHPSL